MSKRFHHVAYAQHRCSYRTHIVQALHTRKFCMRFLMGMLSGQQKLPVLLVVYLCAQHNLSFFMNEHKILYQTQNNRTIYLQ